MTRNIILGTDWWTDCDDIAAVRIACHGKKMNAWDLKGIIINACMPYSVPSLNAFLTHESFSDMPVGIDLTATDFTGQPSYQQKLAEYPHGLLKNEDCADGLELYQKILTESPDNSVEIIEIGFPHILGDLMKSSLELVKQKVNKIWMMAGNWANNGCGSEHNIALTPKSRKGAAEVFDLCPVPIILLGWEVGADVIVGGKNITDENDLLTVGFDVHGSSGGRSAWDPMLVLLALENDLESSGYKPRYGKAHVNIETGENSFEYYDDGPHCYVEKIMDNDFYKNKINNIIR